MAFSLNSSNFRTIYALENNGYILGKNIDSCLKFLVVIEDIESATTVRMSLDDVAKVPEGLAKVQWHG